MLKLKFKKIIFFEQNQCFNQLNVLKYQNDVNKAKNVKVLWTCTNVWPAASRLVTNNFEIPINRLLWLSINVCFCVVFWSRIPNNHRNLLVGSSGTKTVWTTLSPPEIHIVLPFDLVLSLDQWTKNSEQKRWPQSPGRGTCLHILVAERWHQLKLSGEITVSSRRVWAGHPSNL